MQYTVSVNCVNCETEWNRTVSTRSTSANFKCPSIGSYQTSIRADNKCGENTTVFSGYYTPEGKVGLKLLVKLVRCHLTTFRTN